VPPRSFVSCSYIHPAEIARSRIATGEGPPRGKIEPLPDDVRGPRPRPYRERAQRGDNRHGELHGSQDLPLPSPWSPGRRRRFGLLSGRWPRRRVAIARRRLLGVRSHRQARLATRGAVAQTSRCPSPSRPLIALGGGNLSTNQRPSSSSFCSLHGRDGGRRSARPVLSVPAAGCRWRAIVAGSARRGARRTARDKTC
jgi:hypothetical protein